MADFNSIVADIRNNKLAPVYLLDGEEPYYLDLLVGQFEELLPPAERDFNLMTLYGKDSDWADVVNACRRFPMFSEKQVVILKDAAQLRGLNELAGYLENPSPTTVFVLEHRFKKADARSKLVKLAKTKGVHFTADKIKDEAVPKWIENFGKTQGWSIGQREAEMLAGYLGNDLQKIANELSKVRLNAPEEKELSAQLIQRYIGISREYNVFDFPEALTGGNKEKLYQMLTYFIANPKSAPMPLLVGALYNHLERMYRAQFLRGVPEKDALAKIGGNPYFAKNYLKSAPNFRQDQVERCILTLGDISGAAVGIDSNLKDGELLKELVGKIELILGK